VCALLRGTHNKSIKDALANNGANQIPQSSYSTIYGKDKTSNYYYCLSGTSMASPVVAGAAALMLQKYPSLSPDTIKARLMLAADKPNAWCDAYGNYDACTYGAGYLNIPAALDNKIVVSSEYAISPSLSLNADGSVTVNDDHAMWGCTSVTSDNEAWGSHAMWGCAGITDLCAIWGDHAMWGSDTLASSHAMWGSSVWGDHAMWGSSFDGVDLSSVAMNGE
jgi:serine protease AprX